MFKYITRVIKHEFGLKLMSLLAAAILWLYVMNTSNPLRFETIERKIEAINIPAGLSLSKVRPEMVRVHLQGRLLGLEKERLANLRVVADLSDGKIGRNQAILEVVTAPDRVEVMNLERGSAQIWLDPQASRTLPVTPFVEETPAEGYTLTGMPESTPREASVSGPASAVELVHSIVAKVDVSNISASRTVRVKLEAQDKDGSPVSGTHIQPEFVNVKLKVVEAASRRVPVAVLLTDPPKGWVVAKVEVDPQEVILTGTQAMLGAMKKVPTQRVDISTLRGSRTVQVELQVPSDTRPAGDGDLVQVTITTVRDEGSTSISRMQETLPADARDASAGKTTEPPQAIEPKSGTLEDKAPSEVQTTPRKPSTNPEAQVVEPRGHVPASGATETKSKEVAPRNNSR